MIYYMRTYSPHRRTRSSGGQVEMVSMLLSHGADKTLLEATGRTATELAETAGHATLLEAMQLVQ